MNDSYISIAWALLLIVALFSVIQTIYDRRWRKSHAPDIGRQREAVGHSGLVGVCWVAEGVPRDLTRWAYSRHFHYGAVLELSGSVLKLTLGGRTLLSSDVRDLDIVYGQIRAAFIVRTGDGTFTVRLSNPLWPGWQLWGLSLTAMRWMRALRAAGARLEIRSSV